MPRLMQTLRVGAAALSFAATMNFAAAQESKGDPAPDTRVAEGYLKRGRYEDAIRQSKLALGRDERYVPAMIVLAKAYYNNKKYELAGQIIDIAKQIDPNNPELYNLLGFLALTRNDRIGATSSFKKATEVDGNFAPGWINLTAQYLYAKNYDGAVQAGEKAVHLQPNSKTHMNLGSAYRGAKKYTDADKAFKKALEFDPQNGSVYFNLGILYLDAKDYPGVDLMQRNNLAINYLTRYRQLSAARMGKDDPVDGYLAEARKAIENEQKRLDRLKKQQERNQPKAGGK